MSGSVANRLLDCSETPQGGPAVVNSFTSTLAVAVIAVLAALRTDASAIFIADQVHGQREQNVLPQNVCKFHPIPVVESDLGLACVYRDFAGQWTLWRRTIKQVE